MEYPRLTIMEQRASSSEMRERNSYRDTFFSLKREPQRRPMSVATEFVDTDWDEDDILSDFEEPLDNIDHFDNSPRASLHSAGRGSIATISSYDEATTPRSSQGRIPDVFVEMEERPVEGPRGPHLFRDSLLSTYSDDHVLTLSPITPSTVKDSNYLRAVDDSVLYSPNTELASILAQATPTGFTSQHLDTFNLASWNPSMVAQSMLNAGVEFSVAQSFIDNDINGAILMTLKFEDLKELHIQSFGVRIKIWNQIQVLRDCKAASPLPPTPIEDVPSRDVCKTPADDLPRSQSTRRRRVKGSDALEDIISPMESVSIVGIEQVIPKPHNCPKGEACSKFRKQRRLIEAFKKEHPLASLDNGVLLAGNPGNPVTADRMEPDDFRPASDAIPSIVASSDVMGPGGLPPLQYLRQAALQNAVQNATRNAQRQDPPEHVKQFLDFQRSQSAGGEVPPTPPFEILPQTQMPHQGLRHLPKLSIPGKPPSPPTMQPTIPVSQSPVQLEEARPHSQGGFIPYTMNKASPLAQDLVSPLSNLRRGTPFSEMDVPYISMPIDPLSRDVSQSVPPDMNYRAPVRAASRASSRRPSFPVMPPVDENRATPPVRQGSKTPSPTLKTQQQKPLRAPPRVNYPWSPIERTKPFETAIPPFPNIAQAMPVKEAVRSNTMDGATYQGPMKKRKTHFLRHEWQDGYFTLKGTRLAMHKDAKEVDRTLEYVDIDDYAIACSSYASQSKLSAALKTMHIRQGKTGKADVAAFAFQLIPQDKQGGKLKKRDSVQAGDLAEGVNGTGKTHHFAVKGREERIDWMRELMLAKALKQKGEGFQISVNGNMI
ncbi:hypothetical protein jhhlp_007364 [Lomentospora prolificans]|uniref:SAM domain-containing protein n=1 Tax=Lomentospora prolificans TaxID=41688 RepID=A0A2N3N2F2_9PEZI|nr:hypothetical protein jhhlp_007364 [Lomentospora prolificans]